MFVFTESLNTRMSGSLSRSKSLKSTALALTASCEKAFERKEEALHAAMQAQSAQSRLASPECFCCQEIRGKHGEREGSRSDLSRGRRAWAGAAPAADPPLVALQA